ncbi:thyroid peroxidase-like isoform X2 [Acanthaster planci]|uniref:Thyroid peroxidase-like isoform X2 n=1 Tax=Acanthaster planci TaxID=133434 RepID=A0A8B7Z4Q6_ACAPL|nr:thyroid peroxidase-like isoform X2 [Acanthaster planci]
MQILPSAPCMHYLWHVFIFGRRATKVTLESSRDPVEVLGQFKSVQSVSVGEANLLTFLESDDADFITRIDSAMANNLIDQVIHRLQPATDSTVCSDSTRRYRTPDGTCNNQEHPEWGMANLPLRRFLPSSYDDDKKAPRKSSSGYNLPSARMVSIGATNEVRELLASGYSALNVHFGQLLSHDLSQVPQIPGKCSDCQMSDICFPIPIPTNDPVFTDQKCFDFSRSVGTPSRYGDQPWACQQTNRITSYLDASFVYGSSLKTMDSLRIRSDPQGLLRVTPNPDPSKMDLLPPDNEISNCAGQDAHITCGKSGDSRTAEQVGLTALHTVWLREHNRIARELSRINYHWNGDRVFHEARKIVGAEWQHIVYNEYLPLLIGKRVARLYGLDVNLQTGAEYAYDGSVDATIRNGFATAAFRLGHSQISATVWRVDQHFERVFSDIKTREAFFNATHIYDTQGGGSGAILRGMLVQPLDGVDRFFSSAVRSHLFEDPVKGFGLDLIALNIQRGRDHGLPGYVRFRAEVCGFGLITTWEDLEHALPRRIAKRLRRIYRSVEDIDPFVGLFAERHLPGTLVGPTLACLLAKQFSYLKQGDRFWYENTEGEQALTSEQREEIQKSSMARVLCDNTDDLLEIQPCAFLMPDDDELWSMYRRQKYEYESFVEYSKYHRYPDRNGQLRNFSNRRANCEDESRIPRMDLNAWAER